MHLLNSSSVFTNCSARAAQPAACSHPVSHAMLSLPRSACRPYVRRLHAESKALAGMMSLLPAEVDIESHIKIIVLGFSKDRVGGSMRSVSMQDQGPGGPRGPGGGLPPFGGGPGGPGPMRLLPGPPGAAGPGGWFGGRGQGSAPGDMGGYGYGGPGGYGSTAGYGAPPAGAGWGSAPGR